MPAKFLVDVEVAQEGASIGLLLAVAGAIGALVPSPTTTSVVAT